MEVFLRISEREFHTILAALRHYQRDNCPLPDIASNDYEVEPLTPAEIDELAKRIN